ncbi:hypothetical protein F0L68_29770 [Solihabitans fulvus]|uniref:Uncharacterized protein n=1 Tax=Solihabitans fulvus TaxID=1892852 RepID=A0A5B2WTA1_9PSEU|nr:hypothetical protein [Solihabitans fulvus]KAA2254961.1 hypothetical protein F0L68_29770 [Solihabitans fulvus]
MDLPVVLPGRGDADAAGLDALIRRHLALMLIATQTGDDRTVLWMARAETHRLVAAINASLRAHQLDQFGHCATCQSARCVLRAELSRALLPVREPSDDG